MPIHDIFHIWYCFRPVKSETKNAQIHDKNCLAIKQHKSILGSNWCLGCRTWCLVFGMLNLFHGMKHLIFGMVYLVLVSGCDLYQLWMSPEKQMLSKL